MMGARIRGGDAGRTTYVLTGLRDSAPIDELFLGRTGYSVRRMDPPPGRVSSRKVFLGIPWVAYTLPWRAPLGGSMRYRGWEAYRESKEEEKTVPVEARGSP